VKITLFVPLNPEFCRIQGSWESDTCVKTVRHKIVLINVFIKRFVGLDIDSLIKSPGMGPEKREPHSV
jgi:hypothetical protein